MSIQALKVKFDQITRKSPNPKDILSLIGKINQTASRMKPRGSSLKKIQKLQKSMTNFTSRNLHPKHRKHFMNTVYEENRKRTIRRNKQGIKPSVLKKLRENRNAASRPASRNVSRSRASR